MTNIHSLPDLCLLMIFDGVPLDSLAHNIGRVCHRWNSLKSSAFARRHELILFVYYEKPNEAYLGIQLKSFTHLTTQKVIHLFPNVTSLTVQHEFGSFQGSSFDLNALTDLLTHRRWSSQLISLQLIIKFSVEDANVNILTPAIVDALNRLSSLKYLRLACSTCFDDGTGFKPQFPIIGQLEEFHMYTSSDTDPIEWVLKYAEPNTALRKIEIDIQGKPVTSVESLLKLSPQLAAKFICLYSRIAAHNLFDNSQLAQYCSYFASMQIIDIVQGARGGTFAEKLACLSPLKQLGNLTFFLLKIDQIENPLKVEPFESVHNLNLILSENIHKTVQFMKSFNFVRLFPKLKSMLIYCKFIEGFGDDNDDENKIGDDDDQIVRPQNKGQRTNKQKQSHYERMIEPLMKCEHLREIEYGTDDFKAKWTRSGNAV